MQVGLVTIEIFSDRRGVTPPEPPSSALCVGPFEPGKAPRPPESLRGAWPVELKCHLE
jgi:hypothetical protein